MSNTTDKDDLTIAEESLDIAEAALNEFMEVIVEGDIDELKDTVGEEVRGMCSSAGEAEYAVTMAENLKHERTIELGEINVSKENGEIAADVAKRKKVQCWEDLKRCYPLLARAKKLQKKLSFSWDFTSWRYNTLLSESMNEMAKKSNLLAKIAVAIAIISLLISLFV